MTFAVMAASATATALTASLGTVGATIVGGLAGAAVGAAGGAALGAGTSALTGGDVGKGAMMGAIGGGVGGGVAGGFGAAGAAGATANAATQGLSAAGQEAAGLGAATSPAAVLGQTGAAGTATNVGIMGAAGAAGGAASSAAGGDDIGKGALLGGIVGGVGGATMDVPTTSASEIADAKMIQASNIAQAENAAAGTAQGNVVPLRIGAPQEIAQTNLVNAANAASTVPTPPVVAPTLMSKASEYALPAAGVLGAGYLMTQGDQGLMASETPSTPSIYDPIPYNQGTIQRTTVPKYYQYAEGGIVPPQSQQSAQPQQVAQPMNKFVQMGLDMAQQTQQAQQAQQAQVPRAGIPVAPTQMQPQQAFAEGGLASGMSGEGVLKNVYGAGVGKSVAPGVGNVMFGDGKHEDFMQQVQQQAQQQVQQQLITEAQRKAMLQKQAQMQQYAQTAQPRSQVINTTNDGMGNLNSAVQPTQMAAAGGMMKDNLGGYSHGGIAGLTRGPGDGVSDSIPAQIGDSGKQPARLADGEFVIPARIVSELGNGSTEAGAKSLQAMVDRVQKRRSKTVGKGKVAVDSKARKGLLA
jgi:hypothetical protein